MDFEKIKINEIIPSDYNPRLMSNDEFEKLKESIGVFGLVDPIIVNLKNNKIVGGHQRYDALIEQGVDELFIIRLGNIGWVFSENNLDIEDEISEKALNIALNKISGEWDEEKLKELLKEITDSDLDITTTGFEELSVDDSMNFEELDEISHVEDKEEMLINVQKGDVWKLGEHHLMCGDSTSEEDVDKLFGDCEGNVKCLFTSPPYNMGSDLYDNYDDDYESSEYIDFNLNIVNNWGRKINGFLFWNISYNKNSRWEFIEILYKIIKETDFDFMELIVWDKGTAMPILADNMLTRQYEDILVVNNDELKDWELIAINSNNKDVYFNKKNANIMSNYWRISSGGSQLDIHGACFPIELPSKAIALTTDEGDIVADCFGGSGTTLIACEELNRKCYMMEYDEEYCQIIINRWEKHTGKTAEKI